MVISQQDTAWLDLPGLPGNRCIRPIFAGLDRSFSGTQQGLFTKAYDPVIVLVHDIAHPVGHSRVSS